jgi:hypothetical protein
LPYIRPRCVFQSPRRATEERVLVAEREVEPVGKADLPEASSTDYSRWSDLIRTMLFKILDDIDSLVGDIFVNIPPSRSWSLKGMLGILEDHDSAVP